MYNKPFPHSIPYNANFVKRVNQAKQMRIYSSTNVVGYILGYNSIVQMLSSIYSNTTLVWRGADFLKVA